MADMVYVLGAGLNQAIKIKHAVKRKSTKIPHIPHVSPPMGRNFFQEALSMQSRRFGETPYKETLAHGITPLSFYGTESMEPSVISWMPAAAIYFRDPDGHLIEYLTMLKDKESRQDIGVVDWSEWFQ